MRDMNRIALRFAALAPLALVLACSIGQEASFPADARSRAAYDTPPAFEFRGAAGTASDACRNPMVDPRDGAELRLVRSSGGRGDYEVPPGRYGAGEEFLLRLECGSGRPIGLVPR